MFYDEDTVTDQPQRQIVAEVIREKALHALDAEIPHGIAVAIDKMKERPGKNPMVDIEATIICERFPQGYYHWKRRRHAEEDRQQRQI